MPTSPACRSTTTTTFGTRSSARRRGTPRCTSPPARSRRRCSATIGIEVHGDDRRRGGAARASTRRARSATRSAASSRCGRPDVPPGLGTYAAKEDRLDARLAAALMGIQAVKGVEIGDGFALAGKRGSEAHDEIAPDRRRTTNHAGGIEAGISNGEEIVVRAAMKPLPTLMKPLQSVDLATGEPAAGARRALRRRRGRGARRRRRGGGRLGARGAGARQVRRRRDRRLRRRAPRRTSTASNGAERARPSPRARRVHGRGEDDDRPRRSRSVCTGRFSTSTGRSRSATRLDDPAALRGER